MPLAQSEATGHGPAANHGFTPVDAALYRQLVIYRSVEDIDVPWYMCEACGNRGPYEEIGIESTAPEDNGEYKCSQCGEFAPFFPVGCNFEVDCSRQCEQTGCNASDCVETVKTYGTCPMCAAPATLKETKGEWIASEGMKNIIEQLQKEGRSWPSL